MKRGIVFLLILSVSVCLVGQNTNSTDNIKLDELRTPSSPGFSILGLQPTDISRPKSWRSLETTLSNSFFDGDKLIVPQNFAVEFNPFFATKRLKPDESPSFIFGGGQRDFGFNVRANSSFSVATGMFPNYYDTTVTNPRMGLGYRTQLLSMKPTPEGRAAYGLFMNKATSFIQTKSVMDDFVDEVKNRQADTTQLIPAFKKMFITELKATTQQGASIDTGFVFGYIDLFVAPVVTKMQERNEPASVIADTMRAIILRMNEDPGFRNSYEAVKAAIKQRYGSSLEIAGAMLLDFPSNDIYFSKVPKFGLWMTYTYRSRNQHWEFGGMARFITSKFDTAFRYNNIDFGGRIMLGSEKWSINGEVVQRLQWEVVDNKPAGTGQNEVTFRYKLDFKAALTVNYLLTEDLIINYTFGNNLKVNTEFEKEPNLISVVGIAYAFGGPRVKDIK